MTENEVLKDLQNYQGILKAKTRINAGVNPEIALNAITEAIEVIQSYREIGTVDECAEMQVQYNYLFHKMRKFESVGTIEEFKALKEKNTPKKVAYQGEHEKCPNCGSFHVFGKHCTECGQAVDYD